MSKWQRKAFTDYELDFPIDVRRGRRDTTDNLQNCRLALASASVRISNGFQSEGDKMKTIQMQMSITLSDDAAKDLCEILGPALRQTIVQPCDGLNERRDARLRASQNALFAGQKPPEDQGLLIDSRQAAKLLRVSERTLWKMQNGGEMPPPIRIGRAVRWSLEALKTWIHAGCPKQNGAPDSADGSGKFNAQ